MKTKKTGSRKYKPKKSTRIDNTRRRVASDFACAHCGPPKMSSRWLKIVGPEGEVQYVATCFACWYRVYAGGTLERDAQFKAESREAQREQILTLLKDGIGGERARLPDIARKLGVSIHTVRRRLQA